MRIYQKVWAIALIVFAFWVGSIKPPEVVEMPTAIVVQEECEPLGNFLATPEDQRREYLEVGAKFLGLGLCDPDSQQEREAKLNDRARQLAEQIKQQRLVIWQQGYEQGFEKGYAQGRSRR